MSEGRNVAPIGVQGNAWSAASVSSNGLSAIVDTWSLPFVTVFGNTSTSVTITVYGSMDGVNFYTLATISANGDFAANYTSAARYFQLQSSGAATISAIIAAK